MEHTAEDTMANRIRLAREQTGLTQEEVAEALDVSRQAVGKWETGQSRPSTDNLIRLAQVLRTNLQALTLGETAESGAGAAAQKKCPPERAEEETAGSGIPGRIGQEEKNGGEDAEQAGENFSPNEQETAADGPAVYPAAGREPDPGRGQEAAEQTQEARDGGPGSLRKDPRVGKFLSAGLVIGCLIGAAVTLAVSVWTRPGKSVPGPSGEGPEQAAVSTQLSGKEAQTGTGAGQRGGEAAPAAGAKTRQEDGKETTDSGREEPTAFSGEDTGAGAAGTEADETETAGPSYEENGSEAFPETLTVRAEDCRRFGSYANYDVPADAETVEENLLFQYRFPDSEFTLSFYRERSTYTDDLGRPLWHLLAAYDSGQETEGKKQYTVIARLKEDEPDAGNPRLAFFEALGYQGCKLTCSSWMFDSKDTYYFAVDEKRRVPVMLALFQGEPVEADLDSDGENEILSFDSPYEAPAVFDRGVEEYTAYSIEYPGRYTLSCRSVTNDNTGEAAVILTAPDGTEADYRHLWNGELIRQLLPCSSAGMEDVAPEVQEAVVCFVPEGYTDTGDPDLPFPGAEGAPSQRQLAYRGLQCLWELTGYVPRRCYAKATQYSVYFGLEPDCENSFFCIDRGERWGAGENVIGGIHLSWKQDWVEWSPLEPEKMAVDTEDKQALALWTYEQLAFLQEGGIVSAGWGLSGDVRLFLEDGRFFEVSFDEKSGLPNRMQGPYPQGFEH